MLNPSDSSSSNETQQEAAAPPPPSLDFKKIALHIFNGYQEFLLNTHGMPITTMHFYDVLEQRNFLSRISYECKTKEDYQQIMLEAKAYIEKAICLIESNHLDCVSPPLSIESINRFIQIFFTKACFLYHANETPLSDLNYSQQLAEKDNLVNGLHYILALVSDLTGSRQPYLTKQAFLECMQPAYIKALFLTLYQFYLSSFFSKLTEIDQNYSATLVKTILSGLLVRSYGYGWVIDDKFDPVFFNQLYINHFSLPSISVLGCNILLKAYIHFIEIDAIQFGLLHPFTLKKIRNALNYLKYEMDIFETKKVNEKEGTASFDDPFFETIATSLISSLKTDNGFNETLNQEILSLKLYVCEIEERIRKLVLVDRYAMTKTRHQKRQLNLEREKNSNVYQKTIKKINQEIKQLRLLDEKSNKSTLDEKEKNPARNKKSKQERVFLNPSFSSRPVLAISATSTTSVTSATRTAITTAIPSTTSVASIEENLSPPMPTLRISAEEQDKHKQQRQHAFFKEKKLRDKKHESNTHSHLIDLNHKEHATFFLLGYHKIAVEFDREALSNSLGEKRRDKAEAIIAKILSILERNKLAGKIGQGIKFVTDTEKKKKKFIQNSNALWVKIKPGGDSADDWRLYGSIRHTSPTELPILVLSQFVYKKIHKKQSKVGHIAPHAKP